MEAYISVQAIQRDAVEDKVLLLDPDWVLAILEENEWRKIIINPAIMRALSLESPSIYVRNTFADLEAQMVVARGLK
jgi:hypothetical protein